MFVRLKEGEQKRLIEKAIAGAGSQRKLAKLIGTPYQNIIGHLSGKLMQESRFNKLADIVGIRDKDRMVKDKLPDNWRQIIGGKNCVAAKKEKGTFNRDMKIMQDIQAEKLKEWHKSMKRDRPKEYFLLQYSRFKKVADYKYTTINGEKVRNELERDVANILAKNNVRYQYEPLIRIGRTAFFPDFLIGKNIVVECTMWRGVEKAYKLQTKISAMKGRYKVWVVIPKTLYRYYKPLDSSLIQGLDEFASLAQTFPKQIGKGSNR